MPKRLGVVLIGKSVDKIKQICEESGLLGYEEEIIERIYTRKESLNFIADTMDFKRYGKTQDRYSVRTINNMHKEALKKIFSSKKIKQ